MQRAQLLSLRTARRRERTGRLGRRRLANSSRPTEGRPQETETKRWSECISKCTPTTGVDWVSSRPGRTRRRQADKSGADKSGRAIPRSHTKASERAGVLTQEQDRGDRNTSQRVGGQRRPWLCASSPRPRALGPSFGQRAAGHKSAGVPYWARCPRTRLRWPRSRPGSRPGAEVPSGECCPKRQQRRPKHRQSAGVPL